MLESWLFGFLFVGGVTFAVYHVARAIVRSDEARDARNRNHRGR